MRIVDFNGLQIALANYVLVFGLSVDLDALMDNYWESFDPNEAPANEPLQPGVVLDFTRPARCPR